MIDTGSLGICGGWIAAPSAELRAVFTALSTAFTISGRTFSKSSAKEDLSLSSGILLIGLIGLVGLIGDPGSVVPSSFLGDIGDGDVGLDDALFLDEFEPFSEAFEFIGLNATNLCSSLASA